MAEIKSTIDLIMERTKNLSLSEEEKEAIRKREAEGKIHGWIQRYRDGVLTLRDLKKEYSAERKDYPGVDGLFRSALLEQVEPAADNKAVLEMMEKVLKEKTEPILEEVNACREELLTVARERLDAEREALLQRGVSGPAAIPNSARDKTLAGEIRKRRTDLRERLRKRFTA